ncbi:MAG: DUF2027 domain-containing protein [Muribaculaceae bacterium]|nr:DUF2027 domain-containing protein [Muribaculaceae bacterium]
MINPGDTVRYLNSVGGGVVTRIDGKIAYVDDNGFETPFQIKELVVVLPAGHEKPEGGARLMFDQKAYDMGKQSTRPGTKPAAGEKLPKDRTPEPAPLPPVPETEHGDRLTIALAFEPSDVKRLSEATFNAVLVNDSNYTLQFYLAGRNPDSTGWSVIYQGDVQPNELIDLAQFSHSTLGRIERIVFQAIAFKADREFEIKDPIAVMRKLDLTKFHKLHCFRPGRFFDTPVLEFPLINADRMQRQTN